MLELLTKESGLLRDRQILAREVEFLRQQLCANGVDTNRFCSSHTVLVNDIIGTVRLEQAEREQKPTPGELDAQSEGFGIPAAGQSGVMEQSADTLHTEDLG